MTGKRNEASKQLALARGAGRGSFLGYTLLLGHSVMHDIKGVVLDEFASPRSS